MKEKSRERYKNLKSTKEKNIKNWFSIKKKCLEVNNFFVLCLV